MQGLCWGVVVIAIFAFAGVSAAAINHLVPAEKRQPYGQMMGAATTACVALVAASWAWQAVQEQLAVQSKQINLQTRIANATLSDQLGHQRISLRELSAATNSSRSWIEVAGDVPVQHYIVRQGDKISIATTTLSERRDYLKQVQRDALNMQVLNARANLNNDARLQVDTLASCSGLLASTAQRPAIMIIGLDNVTIGEPEWSEFRKKIDDAEKDIHTKYVECAAVWDKVHDAVFSEIATLDSQIKSMQDGLK
jgi:hypothetical protein